MERIRSLITDALIAGALTFLMYAGAYLYELTYLSYFDVPAYFISVDLEDVLFVGSIVLAYCIVCVQICDFLYGVFKPQRSQIRRRMYRYIALMIAIQIPLIAVLWDPAAPGRSFFTAALIISAVVANCYSIAFESKNKQRDASDAIEDKDDLFDKIAPGIGMYPTVPFTLLIFFIVFCATLGDSYARKKEYFLVPVQSPNVIIITKNDSILIGVALDASKKRSIGNVQLYDTTVGTSEYELHHVGRIR